MLEREIEVLGSKSVSVVVAPKLNDSVIVSALAVVLVEDSVIVLASARSAVVKYMVKLGLLNSSVHFSYPASCPFS